MAIHGSISEFSGKDWLSYQEQLKFYFEANDNGSDKDSKNVQYFYQWLDQKPINYYAVLLHPRNHQNAHIRSYVNYRKNISSLKPNTILELYNFYPMFRESG